MTLCKVSYRSRASVRLSEHEHNAVQTLKEYQSGRVKHSSKFVSCRERCLLGHVHIFSSIITSLCETSYVVIFDVSHAVPNVFLYYNDVMLDVPENAHIGITTFKISLRQRNNMNGAYSYQSGLPL